MAEERILITGGAGKVATLLRPLLARPGRTLRLLDVSKPEPAAEPAEGGEEVVIASVDDLDAMVEACRDVDAVIHLGGQSREAGVEEVLRLNAYGTYCVLEAARRAGVNRVVLASSNHAAGFHRRQDAPAGGLPADVPGRPDTLYGWSKVAAEAAGQLYADRFGMDVICLRIGLWFPRPPGLRGLALWLSPDDGARLVEACLAADSPGYRIVWGVSRNTRRWWSLAEGEAIGYHPVDDAETYADELVAAHGEPDFDTDPVLDRVGGQWCEVPLGER
ncbi:NAD-dependent epimerase/dehydratase family protein, partial [Micromonospora marina]|uniref:NAD-dependent epimerase/dehydratase family protein n=1 Tax=Micromonospora marina TaxID=307120 RepID=UPI003D725B8B